MSRLSIALVALVGIFAGELAVSLLRPQPQALTDSSVRAIITDMLATDRADAPKAVADLDAGKVNQLIEDYLMSDPTILQRMNTRMQQVQKVAERKAQKDLIDAQHAAIYEADGNVVLGNPDGDVTLVEMFDYNCSYCRGALPDMATLLAEDPNLKVILKEFPILTSGSVDAARVAVLVSENPKINYWDFHQALFSTRGQVDASAALKVAEDLGGNRVEMMLDMNGRKPAEVIQKSYDLAKALDVTGTPTYIIGDEMIPGAIGIDQLRTKIANVRQCGSTDCSLATPSPTPSPAG